MSSFLTTELNLANPGLVEQLGDGIDSSSLGLPEEVGGCFLQRSQEDHFLDLFWHTHHFSFPIIHEAEFRKHYRNSWIGSASGTFRTASPLVDIVLALCVQFGTSCIPHSGATGSPTSDGPCYLNLAGYQYYQRCQSFLENATEPQSITTAQCYIFSIVYLYEVGLLNKAQVMVAKAIMTAVILGLNLEPQDNESEEQKEIHRRTWWSICTLDTQLSIELGRACMVNPSQTTCRPPSDSLDIACSLGPHYMFDQPNGDITWLGFQSQTLRLLSTVNYISCAFYRASDTVLNEAKARDFYEGGAAREKCAHILTGYMKQLRGWAIQLPADYRMPRRRGDPFSTDRSPEPLDLDDSVPICYQRQRLILELQYHLHALRLYRTFICFTPTPEIATPLSDNKAASSLNHAVTLTNMLQQTLTQSEILNGMNQVFRWQQNALFTMLGFAFTYPVSQNTAAARKGIETAIAVIETFRGNVPEAARVVSTARNLAEHINAIVIGFRDNVGGKGDSGSMCRTGPMPKHTPKESPTQGSCGSSSQAESVGLVSPSPQGKQVFMNEIAMSDSIMDLGAFQGLGEDWGDVSALLASVDMTETSDMLSTFDKEFKYIDHDMNIRMA